MKTILTGIVLLFTIIAYSQSTDVVKYYILYDVSGSVASIDTEENLKQLLNYTLNIDLKEKEIDSKVSFEIIFIGEKRTDLNTINWFLPELKGTKNKLISSVLDSLRTQEANKSSQQYTHMLSAINKILSLDSINTTAGLFIFTDGQLAAGDILPVSKGGINHSLYIDSLKTSIHLLREKFNLPVFLVQSSPNLTNNYFYKRKFISKVEYSSDSLKYSNDIFWISNDINISENPIIIYNFKKFLSKAHTNIINSSLKLHAEQNTISTLLKLDKFREIDKIVTTHDSTVLLELTKGKSENAIRLFRELSNISSDTILNYEKSMIYNIKLDSLENKYYHELVKLDSVYNSIVSKKNNQELEKFNISWRTPASFGGTTASISNVSDPEISRSLEETIILGLTDYIIERSQQEAIFAFYENFHENITEKKEAFFIKDTLLYHTFRYFENIDEDYNLDLIYFKEVLTKDISELPNNLILSEQIKISDELIILFYTCNLFQNIYHNRALDDALISLKHLRDTKENNRIDKGIVIIANLVEYLKDNDLESVYIKDIDEELEKIARDIIIVSSPINTNDTIKLEYAYKVIKKFYVDYHRIKNQIEEFNEFLAKTPPNADYLEFNEYKKKLTLDLLWQSSELILSSIDISSIYKDKSSSIKTMNNYSLKRGAKSTVEAWFLIQEQNYSEAIAHLLPLIDTLLTSKYAGNIDYINELLKLIKIGGEVSQAKSDGEVKNIISKYTLPVASYRAKRNQDYTIMLNAYSGIGGNYFSDSSNLSAVISAPIGFEISSNNRTKSSSLSIFMCIVNIGNIIDYRLLNTKSDEVVNFNKIFSPGLFVLYGMSKKYPLSIGAGYQFNPERFEIFFGLDLPLLRIK